MFGPALRIFSTYSTVTVEFTDADDRDRRCPPQEARSDPAVLALDELARFLYRGD